MSPMTPEQERTLDRHGWDLKNIHDLIRRRDSSLMDIIKDVNGVKAEQQKDHELLTNYIAVADAAAKAAEKAAERAVTGKQLYLTGIGIVIALVGLVEAIPHK